MSEVQRVTPETTTLHPSHNRRVELGDDGHIEIQAYFFLKKTALTDDDVALIFDEVSRRLADRHFA